VPAWRVRVLDLGFDARFNYMDREAGPVTDRSLQYRLRSRVRVDLRKDGSPFFVVRAETGKGFDNSWNNTGVGLGAAQSVVNVKSVALHQKFGHGIEAQAGGLDFDPGAGTDAVYASGDGHMTGYRSVFTGARAGLPDRLSFTAGYVGDFDTPNFFSRARMDRVNYYQVLLERRLGESIRASAEVDSIRGVAFGRTAVEFRDLWIFDRAVAEAVVRASGPILVACSSTLTHDWSRDWHSDLIYATLSPAFYQANGRQILFSRVDI
jgi:hypothetical protein